MTPRAEEAAAHGMTIAVAAREAPERMAILSDVGSLTYGELNARANQLARALARRGVGKGDAIALLCSNRPEFAVAYAAALRAGLRLTCINWHLQRDEIAYIVENCEARALLADARFAEVAADVAREASKASVRLAIAADRQPPPSTERSRRRRRVESRWAHHAHRGTP
jgi:long-chain acyl-CoA synthetase